MSRALVYMPSRFSNEKQEEIRQLVSNIRRNEGFTNTTNGNFMYKTTNRSINQNKAQKLNRLLMILCSGLKYSIRRQVQHARLYIRYRSDISSAYINQQTLHVNRMASPNEGRAFIQFIYYIDTPKFNGRQDADVNSRGTLILKPTNRANVHTFVPEGGRIVFFSPDQVLHEVSAPVNTTSGHISRNMIIGFLYRPTRANELRSENRQIRPFGNLYGQPTEMTRRYTAVIRALAGVNRPGRTNMSGSAQNSALASMLRRTLNIRSPAQKRKRSGTGTVQARKRSRLGGSPMNIN